MGNGCIFFYVKISTPIIINYLSGCTDSLVQNFLENKGEDTNNGMHSAKINAFCLFCIVILFFTKIKFTFSTNFSRIVHFKSSIVVILIYFYHKKKKNNINGVTHILDMFTQE